MSSVTLTNAQDTFVRQIRQSENYNGSTRLWVSGTSGQADYAYLYFSRPFPLGATITSAKLRLYVGDGPWSAASRTVTIKRVTEAWKVSRTNWNNKPSVTSTGAVSVTRTTSQADLTLWEFDVTALMQAVSDGTSWYGFRIESNESARRKFNSSGAYSHKPTLIVTWSDKPDAPTTLSPSGNRAVSTSKPVLRFDFTDHSGNVTMNATQVQLSATDSTFATVDFDTGTVITGVPQIDLSTTSYAGLAAGSSTYWRVRVQDASGLWSDWSKAAQFSMAAKGSVAITNPAAAPNNYVQEPTPPISWTVSNATQARWKVVIEDGTHVLHSSGERTGTETEYTLPSGVIKDDNTYTVSVYVWDSVSRESVPGDPPYMVTSATFNYQRSATVTTVSGLTMTPQTPQPAALLSWTRGTAPDYWEIVRDGVVIDTNILGPDLLTTGTSYQYIDKSASAKTAHTWEVRAKVNGVTSSGNPTVTGTLSQTGIWLMDPDQDIAVQILGDDAGSFANGEVAEVYAPVGSSKVIRITQAMRGLEGSISGQLVDTTTSTVADAVSNLYAIKQQPGKTFQLALGDISIPVVIGNLTIAPEPYQETTKNVSFDFWQVGDLPFKAVR